MFVRVCAHIPEHKLEPVTGTSLFTTAAIEVAVPFELYMSKAEKQYILELQAKSQVEKLSTLLSGLSSIS